VLQRREARRRSEHPAAEQQFHRRALLALAYFEKGRTFRRLLRRFLMAGTRRDFERAKCNGRINLSAELGNPRGYFVETLKHHGSTFLRR